MSGLVAEQEKKKKKIVGEREKNIRIQVKRQG